MIDFKKLPVPALSYAVIGTDPDRAEPDAATQIWKLERKNRQLENENRMLENENRMLWTMLVLCWICWVVSLVATLWLADKV